MKEMDWMGRIMQQVYDEDAVSCHMLDLSELFTHRKILVTKAKRGKKRPNWPR